MVQAHKKILVVTLILEKSELNFYSLADKESDLALGHIEQYQK